MLHDLKRFYPKEMADTTGIKSTIMLMLCGVDIMNVRVNGLRAEYSPEYSDGLNARQKKKRAGIVAKAAPALATLMTRLGGAYARSVGRPGYTNPPFQYEAEVRWDRTRRAFRVYLVVTNYTSGREVREMFVTSLEGDFTTICQVGMWLGVWDHC